MRLLSLPLLFVALAASVGTLGRDAPDRLGTTEVVVTLASPPLAYAHGDDAALRLDTEQQRFVEALHVAIPAATTRWRYRVVANGFAVVAPASAIPTLRRLPGVKDVSESTSYQPLQDSSAGQIGAPTLWGSTLATAGQGMKIGIIDDGVDQTHRYFNPRGYTMPAGFPKGQRAYTTAKVIVARAFPPPGATWRNASKPFDPDQSEHATHVAGIAAGNYRTRADGGRRVSGVAPRAYIGNYKALTVPTASGLGLNGNAPEIVAAIEAAVRDAMDVINLSLGEPEIDPTRDVVARALDAAAAAGVVPVVAAGNSFDELGAGSVGSPGSSARAITVAAASLTPDKRTIAYFSSAGPTSVSQRLKPDVTAPGVDVLSSVPGGWSELSGTSMAAPHVAGAVALLLQRHPGWTVDEVKGALVGTASRLLPGRAIDPMRLGGGVVDLAAANAPFVVASPSSVSFGLLRPGDLVSQPIALTDTGGGAGTWAVSVNTVGAPAGTVIEAPATVSVPGSFELTALAAETQGETMGSLLLTREGVMRRIPFWFRVSVPRLATEPATTLTRPGTYGSTTRGRPTRVMRYRYPDVQPGGAVTARLYGPERVYRLRLRRPVANFGVVVTSRAHGVRVEPRVVAAGDESRLTGVAALPLVNNPYLASFGDSVLAAGALRPTAGSYDIVFDSRTRAGAGVFTFRLWIDDTTPPRARLLTTSVRRGAALRVRVSDGGAGVDPRSLDVTVDGFERPVSLTSGIVHIPTASIPRGRHVLRLRVADYQETRNDENMPRILPNTRSLRATITIR
jgi:subtilisin family serine protease